MTPFPLPDAQFQLASAFVMDIALMKGEEFKDDDYDVCTLVINTMLMTEQAANMRRMLLFMASRVTAAEWSEMVTPELHNWVFATEVTT